MRRNCPTRVWPNRAAGSDRVLHCNRPVEQRAPDDDSVAPELAHRLDVGQATDTARRHQHPVGRRAHASQEIQIRPLSGTVAIDRRDEKHRHAKP